MDAATRAKVDALLAILRGEDVGGECPAIAEGLAADAPLGRGVGGVRALVYARHAETMRLLERALAAAHIAVSPLRGTRVQRDVAVAAVRDAVGDAPHVLLVADARDCAGLHLAALSHIVFFHRVADAAVRAQVVGRAARPGRHSDLAVAELVIEGEINWVGV